MEMSRRDFLKLSGAGIGGAMLLTQLGTWPALAQSGPLSLHKKIGEKTTICSHCGVGCSLIMAVENGEITNLEGDPDSPINQGSLCSKGASLYQLANNDHRMTTVKHRRASAAGWTDSSWDEALSAIANKIKDTRDNSFIETDSNGNIVNRTEAIASLGSVFINNEEAYLLSKMYRALGMVYIENEARVCVSSGVAADIETVGRGPMSNTWTDMVNSDCFMLIGGNMAETFPVAYKQVTKAREKGAKVIHIDPRFTRTSATADLYARVRPGTDIAFINGMIRYVLDDMETYPQNYNMTYVKEYTNASFLINPDFTGPADTQNGLFSGWDGSKYDKTTWAWQTDTSQLDGIKKDPSLTDPDCVFQLLKKHFARYTDEKVIETTGTDKTTFQDICKTYAATGQKDKAGAFIFSSAACQHSTGTQTVRSFGILQLLLGNMGIAGGGLNGLAGAVNGLGCSLQGLINHWGPGGGSVRMPNSDEKNLSQYGGNKARFASILKAWYENTDHNTSFDYLPKREGNYFWEAMFKAIEEGTVKGLICWGINPMVGGANASMVQQALSKLDWLVVVDLWETETAAFWKPEAGADPGSIKTDVFLLPAASSLEKEGSVCNSSRWDQWRYKGINPPGNAMSDLQIANDLMYRLKGIYAGQTDKNAKAITELNWDYGNPVDVHRVAMEMNGYNLSTGELLSSPGALKDDGSTGCGNWLWCGMYTTHGNMAARRGTIDSSGVGIFSDWAWAWPVNRRIMYNRASVDSNGDSWNIDRPVIRWDCCNAKWTGDIADGGDPPISEGGGYPFIMKKPHGRGHLFGPGRPDGPLPEHYEPWESPVSNPMSSQQNNPAIVIWETSPKGSREKYPIMATTHRLVEHMNNGILTRHMEWLVEMMPEMFIEISQELAAEKGIINGDSITVESARGSITGKAMVTMRIKPVHQNGSRVHYICLPWNWGYMGLSKGSITNSLTARVVDPNTGIPEFRSFLCNLRRA